MKRILAAFVLTSFSAFMMVGCAEETTVKSEKVVDTPDGSVKVTDEKTIERTGEAKETAPEVKPEVAAPQ